MMKKYVKPEIEALALETIDVIATSDGFEALTSDLATEYNLNLKETTQLSQTLSDMKQNKWSW